MVLSSIPPVVAMSFKQLPEGSCNFIDLALPNAASRCGCQHFWAAQLSNNREGSAEAREMTWCMCGHHACYHAPGPRRDAALSRVADGEVRGLSGGPAVMSKSFRSPDWQAEESEKRSAGASLRPRAVKDGLSHKSTSRQPTQNSRSRVMSPFEAIGVHATLEKPVNPSRASQSDASTTCLPPIPSQCRFDSQDDRLIARLPLGITGAYPQSPHVPASGDTSPFPSRIDFLKQDAMPLVIEQAAFLDQHEVATPSPIGTPNLSALRQLDGTLKDVRSCLEDLDRDLGEANEVVVRDAHPASSLQRGAATGAFQQNRLVAVLKKALPHLRALTTHFTAYPTFVDSLQNFSRRVDALENASCSNGPIEEMNEKFELSDGRVVELEGRLEELERWRLVVEDENTSEDQRARQRLRSINGVQPTASFASDKSLSSNQSGITVSSSQLIAAAIDRNELLRDRGLLTKLDSNVANLESRVSDLESSSAPSLARPWEVEVVLLPWGSDLGGLWYPVDEFPSLSHVRESQDQEEWIHTRNVTGLSHRSFVQTDGSQPNGWDGAAIRRWANGTDEWRVPRCCGPDDKVYWRLKSRRLVRKVQIKGAASRDVQDAVLAAFGDLPRTLCGEAVPSMVDEYPDLHGYSRNANLGLRAPFIPLRKLHDSSRLRFLDPDEMTTSALWTADFLSASVMATSASGDNRLYLTVRDGYLQYNRDEKATWTWKRIRQLPARTLQDRRSDGNHSSPTGRKSVAQLDCWDWDPALDPPASAVSSFTSVPSQPCSQQSLTIRKTRVTPLTPGGGQDPTHEKDGDLPMSDECSIEDAQHQQLPAIPMSPLSEFPLEQQTHQHALPRPSNDRRTISMPLSLGPASDQPQPSSPFKRRIVSNDFSPTKRSRFSPAPSVPYQSAAAGKWPLPTPSSRRPSNPPSPFSSDPTGPNPSAPAAALTQKKERSPRLAYETPFSGFVAPTKRPRQQSTGRKTVPRRRGAMDEDEAWEGVGDDDDDDEEPPSEGDVADDDDDDDDDDYLEQFGPADDTFKVDEGDDRDDDDDDDDDDDLSD